MALVRRLTLSLTTAALVLALGVVSASAGPYSAHSDLTAVAGEGQGSVSLASTSKPGDLRIIQIAADVTQTAPDTTFSVQRALDPVPDGVCDQIGSFDELGTLTTSPGGDGAVHIERESPSPSGATFDVVFQLVGDEGTILVSECMTVTLK
jgi:hypothetical protein